MKIEDFLRQYEIKFVSAGEHHHARPGWINLDCPFCSPRTNKFRLGYNLYGKYFHCWTCGPQRLKQTLQELTGQSFEKIGLVFNIIERDERWIKEDQRGNLKIPMGLGPLRQPHEDYLRERHLNPTTLQQLWGLKGFGPVANEYSWRLFIPVLFDHVPVSWTSRAIVPTAAQRYLSAPPSMEVYSPKQCLYGEDYCNASLIVVCEGPTDVWKLGPGAVALMGLSYSRKQLARIARYQKRVICFDSDTPGQRRAEMICNELSPFAGDTLNVVLDAPDPGAASAKEVKLFWNAISA